MRRVAAPLRRKTCDVNALGGEAISPSFADELFAKIDQALVDGGAIKFENLSARLEPLVGFVRTGRGLEETETA